VASGTSSPKSAPLDQTSNCATAGTDTNCKLLNRIQWRPVTRSCQRCTSVGLPKAFQEQPGHTLSRGRQNMCTRLWHTPRFLENCWRVCSATGVTKTALGISQFWFKFFAPKVVSLTAFFNLKTQHTPLEWVLCSEKIH